MTEGHGGEGCELGPQTWKSRMGCWGFLGLVGDAGYQVALREALRMS